MISLFFSFTFLFCSLSYWVRGPVSSNLSQDWELKKQQFLEVPKLSRVDCDNNRIVIYIWVIWKGFMDVGLTGFRRNIQRWKECKLAIVWNAFNICHPSWLFNSSLLNANTMLLTFWVNYTSLFIDLELQGSKIEISLFLRGLYYGWRFMTLFKRQWPKPSARKRNITMLNGCLRRPYK